MNWQQYLESHFSDDKPATITMSRVSDVYVLYVRCVDDAGVSTVWLPNGTQMVADQPAAHEKTPGGS